MPHVLRVAAFAALLLAACGGGGEQDRPVVVGSFPAEGQVVPAGLASIRLDFDDKVSVFRVEAVVVARDGVPQGVFVVQEPGEAHSLRLAPLPGQAFEPGSYTVAVRGGLVLNLEGHYALEPQTVSFAIAGATPVYLGSPTTNSVRELDGETLALLTTTPTPGGRDPVGIVAVTHGTATRVFVQLAAGGGTGRSLAYFTPGAGVMTEVVLTPSPGSDLTAVQPALVLGPGGASVFAAFRDVSNQQVRLHRVRVSDGVETGAITLSPAAGAGTAPAGLTVRGDGLTLLVPCHQAAGGVFAYVDIAAFTELDADAATPGVQAASLGGAAGPAEVLFDFLCVAPAGAATAALTFVDLATAALIPDASTQVGTPTAVLVTFDTGFVVEGLGGAGAAPDLLAVRSGGNGPADFPVAVSDLVGLVPQGATAVRALSRVPATRAFLALLDANVLARFTWHAAGVDQVDLDAGTAGIQAAGLAATAPDSTCIGVATAYPP